MLRTMLRTPSVNPYLNLAFESYLMSRPAPRQNLLLLYRNAPSVVVGRHQNIHAECNLRLMQEHGVVPVRRVSGGGAVYHDLGNVNIAFLGPAEQYDQEANYHVVLEALHSLGFAVERNERNDLLLDGKKISGSAFRHSGGTSLHHLTLLVAPDFERLSGMLHGDSVFAYESKGINSVRSEVSSLARSKHEYGDIDTALPTLEHALARSFKPDQQPTVLPMRAIAGLPEVQHHRQRLESEDWIYHKCPAFRARYQELEVWVRDGRIEQFGLIPHNDKLRSLFYGRSWHKSMDEIVMMFDNKEE